jgi:hypothetical protein
MSFRNPIVVPGLAEVAAGLPGVMSGGQRMMGVPVNPGPTGGASVFAAGSTMAGMNFGGAAPFGDMTSSISGTSFGFEANATVNNHLPVRPYKNGMEKNIKQGDLLFVRRRAAADSKLYTVANTQMVNYFLELNDMVDEEEGANGQRPAVHPDGAAANFAEDWNFYGIVQALDAGRKRGLRATSEIEVNATVRGPQYMPNIFGNNVRNGTRLYGIVKPVAFTSDVMIGPDGTELGRMRTRNARSLQVDFFGDWNHDTVPMEKRMYRDEHGMLREAHVFYIGRAMETPHTVNVADRLAALRDQSKYITLSPTFQVCVN